MDFPSSPALNQLYTFSGTTWKWNGVAWQVDTSSNISLSVPITWTTSGIGPPTFNTRSAGTKLVLYPSVGASSVDYALGIETDAMWYSVKDATASHKWYSGITNIATLNNSGLIVPGTITGRTIVQARSSTSTDGFINMQPGNATISGFLEFMSATGGIRQGFIGATNTNSTVDTGFISYTAGTHNFGGIVSVTTSGSTGSITVTDLGANGPNIKLVGTGGTPNKYIRSSSGNLEVGNSAYSTIILTLTDSGNLTVTGNLAAANLALGGKLTTTGAFTTTFTITGNTSITLPTTGTIYSGSAAPVVGGVIYGSSATQYGSTAVGTQNQVLTSNAAAAPTWTTLDLTYIPDAWVKKAVRVASTAIQPITARTATTLTIGGTALTYDGVALVNGDRVLVKNSTSGTGSGLHDNGIYVVSGIGTSVVFTRSSDADTASELGGATVNVDQGTVNGGLVFTNDFKTTSTVGTTAMNWYQLLSSNDATSTNTINKLVLRDGSGNFAAGTITAALSGNATTATTLQTGRTISATGDATGTSGTFDGSAAASIPLTLATVNSNTGSFGSATVVPIITVNAKGLITAVSTATISASSATNITGGTTGALVYQSAANTTAFLTAGTASQVLIGGASAPAWSSTPSGLTSVSATTFTGALTGNATTATTLQTARLINTVSFNGSADITITANTTNALTMNNSGSGAASGTTFNGSTAQTLSYNTLGASPLAGSASLTTLGTVTTGTWNASVIAGQYGGTGVANTGRTITLAGNLTTTGAFATTLNVTNTTSITLPTTGTIYSGSAAPVAGGVIYGSSATQYGSTAAGTQNQVLISNVASAPTWATIDLTYLPDSWVKKSVKAATTAVTVITARTATTLTVGGTALTIDGITFANNDRILVKDSTSGVAGTGANDNGIYVVSGVGSAILLTRTTDADTSSEIGGGAVNIDQGTAQGGLKFATTFKTTDTLGTTAMNWYQVLTLNDTASANTASKVVIRDSSGNFSAGTITATLSGTSSSTNALSATAQASSNTWTGVQYFSTTGAVGVNTNSGYLITGSPTTSTGTLSFRNTAFGLNMGLDSDNWFRLGGWSDGTSVYRFQSDTSGNFYTKGGLSIGGSITTIGGLTPTNNAIRLTPNFHINAAGTGNTVYLNWDNGSAAGGNLSLVVANGATSAVFTVTYDGRVQILNSLGVGASGPNGTAGDINVSRTSSPATGVIFLGNTGRYLYFDSVNYSMPSSSLVVGGDVIAYSDIRVKKNIEVIPDALNKVLQLRGVSFNRTDLGDDTKRHIGVIAQEVEEILPEVVSIIGPGAEPPKEDDIVDKKTVAYGNMVGLLIEAIKELNEKVESLKVEIKSLRG